MVRVGRFSACLDVAKSARKQFTQLSSARVGCLGKNGTSKICAWALSVAKTKKARTRGHVHTRTLVNDAACFMCTLVCDAAWE